MTYTIVTAWDISELEQRVQKKLDDGWTLVGSVTVFHDLTSGDRFVVHLIKSK